VNEFISMYTIPMRDKDEACIAQKW